MPAATDISDRLVQKIGQCSSAGLLPVAWIVLAATGMVTPAECSAEPVPSKLVVVLYPGPNDGSPGSVLADRGIRAALADAAGGNVEIHSEYLDVSGFAQGEHQQEVVQLLGHKYAERKVDLVIAGLSSALNFTLEHRDEMFPGVPIVFMAVDREEVEARQMPPDVIGVPIEMDLSGSLAEALRLFPQTKRVVVVVGSAKFDNFWEARARTAFPPAGHEVGIEYLVGLPIDELLAKVEQLPDHSLIYYLHVMADRDGRIYIPAQVVERMAGRANAPIFGHVDTYLGRGIVGGRVFSFERAGREAGQLGARVLAGEKPAEIGIQPVTGSSYIFDGRELSRWGIHTANLPPGSEIRYRDPTLWEQYKWQFGALVGLCFVQAVLIAGLFVQHRRRARAERQLRERREELRQLTGQILGAQEMERRRIARELHDDFGQDLALLSVELDLVRQRTPELADEARKRMDSMSARVKELSSSIHDLSHQLHPMKLEQLGLVAAIRGLVKELTQHHSLHLEFQSAEQLPAISPEAALCLYRIAQEALRNVVKHSGATRATASLASKSDAIDLVVSDDGKGFDVVAGGGTGGLGLVSMRERLRLVGGELSVDSSPGSGTRLVAHVPLGIPAEPKVKSSMAAEVL